MSQRGGVRPVAGFLIIPLLFFSVLGADAASGRGTERLPVTFSEKCSLTILEDGAYWRALNEAIEQARDEITLAFFYFKTKGGRGSYPDLILASLADAAKRGVRVVVLLEQGRDQEESTTVANRQTANWLRKKGVTVYLDDPQRTMHTKIAVVDGKNTFIGSHNLTQSALKYNREISVLIKSPQVAAEVRDYIKSIMVTAVPGVK